MRDGNIILIWDRMGDYHRARWNAVKKIFPNKKVYAADLGGTDSLYGWTNTTEENFILLSQKQPSKFDFLRVVRFWNLITGNKIDTICLSGYARPEYILFILIGRVLNKKIILFAESWYPSGVVVDRLKSIFLKLMKCRFLVSGQRAYKHFTNRLKISGTCVRIGYSVVDNEHFKNNSPDDSNYSKCLLCIARFAPEKNLSLLISAFQHSKLISEGWKLTLVGGGPLQTELENLIKDNSAISLIPWKNYNELPSIYHRADVFILPSKFEPWGLVVNEAMASGLPIILSDSVGSSEDLLLPGINGWSFASSSEDELISVLDGISSYSKSDLVMMGKSSIQEISKFTIHTFAAQLKSLDLLDRNG